MLPLLRKVRHSLPGTPFTSNSTRVEGPCVMAPAAPAVPPVAVEVEAEGEAL